MAIAASSWVIGTINVSNTTAGSDMYIYSEPKYDYEVPKDRVQGDFYKDLKFEIDGWLKDVI